MESFNDFTFYPNGEVPAPPIMGDRDDFQMGNTYPQFDSSTNQFAHEGPFMGPNDDLNGFFTPSTGVVFDNPNQSSMMAQGQWGNGGDAAQMFSQNEGFPFPPQPAPQQQIPTGMAQPNWIAPHPSAAPVQVHNSATTVEVEPDVGEDQEKPKRGRPRKRKGKLPPTKEQEEKKRERFLERNRAAASKCRKRKKESTEQTVAKAQLYESYAKMLRLRLDEMRAFYGQCLGFAADFAEKNPNSSEIQAHIKSAAERGFLPDRMQDPMQMGATSAMLLEFPDFDPILDNFTRQLHQGNGSTPAMSRENSQQSIHSPRSVYSTMNGLQPSNIQGAYTTEQLRQERISIETMGQGVQRHSQSPTMSQQFVDMDIVRTSGMSRQGSVASHQSTAMSRQGSSASQQSAAMSRRGSYSSVGQTSNKDSGYGSNRTTPKEQKTLSPSAEVVESDPPMMSNQRVQQFQPRQLRSAKASGPADLDDPSVHIARLAKR